jgi:DNA-binding response OmpR family regulator
MDPEVAGGDAVLVVEDDPDVRAMLGLLLRDDGCVTTEVGDGESALAQFDAADPDAALVDLRLPGMSGFDVVQALRARSDIPIIVVTAQTDSEDVVRALDGGADDYVTKPFDPQILLARVRACLRRTPGRPGAQRELRIGDLRIRPNTAEVEVRGEPVAVTRTELGVLVALAEAGGGVMSREELLAEVWRYDYLGDSRMVDAHVRRLRLKLERDPAEPEILLTVRGLGYRLAGDGTTSEA